MTGRFNQGQWYHHHVDEEKKVKNQKVSWVLLCNGAPAIGAGTAAAMAIVNSAFKNNDHLNYLLCHFRFVAPMSVTKIIIQFIIFIIQNT
jgi:hypothetical protein